MSLKNLHGNSEENLTIVMYHYVREIQNSNYPGIKGLEIEGFKRQLDYLQKHFTVIGAEDIFDFSNGKIKKIPKNSCLLTFDDGYKDHIKYVLPELRKRSLKGCFFPAVLPIKENKVLDVNAIQFILAKTNDIIELVNELRSLCLQFGISDEVVKEIWERTAVPSRWDPKEVIFVKRMLQRELSLELRSNIINILFERYVGNSQREFSRDLYMSLDELKELLKEGMYIGNHTYNHFWLGSINKSAQEKEIQQSLNFLKGLGARSQNWIMCYPFGSYNFDTIDLLKKNNCIAALTTAVGTSPLCEENIFELKRMNTNDFPQ